MDRTFNDFLSFLNDFLSFLSWNAFFILLGWSKTSQHNSLEFSISILCWTFYELRQCFLQKSVHCSSWAFGTSGWLFEQSNKVVALKVVLGWAQTETRKAQNSDYSGQPDDKFKSMDALAIQNHNFQNDIIGRFWDSS